MKPRKNRKQKHAEQVAFAAAVVGLLEEHGAIRDPRPILGQPNDVFVAYNPQSAAAPSGGSFWIDTRAGWLSIHAQGDGVFCRFSEPERARRVVGIVNLNTASGKWNHHVFDADPADVLATFGRELARIVPPPSEHRELLRWKDGAPGTWLFFFADEVRGCISRDTRGVFHAETRKGWTHSMFTTGSLDEAKLGIDTTSHRWDARAP